MTPPHHAPGGGFRNPWPNAKPASFLDFLRWRIGAHAAELSPNPPQNSLPRATPSFVHPRASRGERTVTWVGHSTVLLQLGGLNVLTDPIWSPRASPLSWIGPKRLMDPGVDSDSLPPLDVVLVSHNHYDHLDERSVRRLAARHPTARWLCPLGVAGLLRKWGVRDVSEHDWWDTITTPAFRARCTPAQHFSARGAFDRNRTLWCGWTISANDTCVYFAGDTALHPEFDRIGERCGPFDLVIMPIGAYEPRWFMRPVHANPDDAVAAYRALCSTGGATPPCVPVHWGTFRLTDEAMTEPPVRFADAWRAAGMPEESNWTMAVGETRRFGTGKQ